jgi:hypothetical protein
MQTRWVKGHDGVVIPQEYLRETEQHNAEVQAMIALRDELEEWTRDLKRLDERLQMVWAPESVTAPGLVPGRFHVLRRNDPPAPVTPFPLVRGLLTGDPDDEGFIEPGSWVFDWLQKSDLQNTTVQEERKRFQEEAERARQRRKQEEREETIWEIDERLRVANNPGGVLFTKGLS